MLNMSGKTGSRAAAAAAAAVFVLTLIFDQIFRQAAMVDCLTFYVLLKRHLFTGIFFCRITICFVYCDVYIFVYIHIY